MIIVSCPNCNSKFKFSPEGLIGSTLKMRCSVCQHIFPYTLEQDTSLEKEFDMLLSTEKASEPAPVQEPHPDETGRGIVDTQSEEAEPQQAPQESQTPPESVMREIDSILGSGTEVEKVQEEPAPEGTGKKGPLKLVLIIIALLVIASLSLWLLWDRIISTHGAKTPVPQAAIENGPFFAIAENSLSYEILTHEQEGSVLVIKGSLKRTTSRPAESVMVEARVYGKDGNLIESRIAYAGIVPDLSEFTRQPQKDIDALLTAEPGSPGSTLPTGDIPFAVAFFGRPASDGSSFKVEVKEVHWK